MQKSIEDDEKENFDWLIDGKMDGWMERLMGMVLIKPVQYNIL